MLEDYTTAPSIYETESSETPATPADQAGEFEPALLFTPIPWYARQDEDGDWQKVPALAPGFSYENFEYGKPVVPYDQWGITGYDRWGQPVRRDVQPGYLTTFKSGVIVFDQDKRGFFEWLESIGIHMPPAPEVSTGKPDGRHRVFDGRRLSRDQWPRQRNYAGLGDVKSNGFCAAPGALHPSGRRYELTRPMPSPPRYDPQWTWLLDEWWEANGHGTGGSHERGKGSGRNNELLRYKGMLYRQGIEQDDPEMARRVLAYNATFAEPQSEPYVRATVLRLKRWTRDSIKAAEHLDASAGQGRTRPGCHPPAAEGDAPGGPGAGLEAAGAATPLRPAPGDEGVSAGQQIIGLLRGGGSP
jgi:Bifunctional DNA primase/polymerase, N-terminal